MNTPINPANIRAMQLPVGVRPGFEAQARAIMRTHRSLFEKLALYEKELLQKLSR